MGGKTGFISKAGYCLATLLRLARRAITTSPSSSSAPRRTTAASGRRATCSTGCPTRRRCLQAEIRSNRAALVALLIALLHRCRVQRQRRHSIHSRHHRARRLTGVVRLEVALADVARVEPVAAVAAGERRDLLAIGVQAERAGRAGGTASARCIARRSGPLGGRRDDGKVRLAAAERAGALLPAGEVDPRHDRFGRARQERPHRLQQHAVEAGDLRRIASAPGRTASYQFFASASKPIARRARAPPPAGSLRPRALRGCASRPRSPARGTACRPSRPESDRSRGSARSRAARSGTSASRGIDGSDTRDCTRRCSCSSSICRSTAAARSG